MNRSGLERAAVSSLGRWRVSLHREGDCTFELIAPGRREELLALAALARESGFSRVNGP